MPVISFRYELPEVYKISRMRYHVLLCSMHDVVNQQGQMTLAREGIRKVWANIAERRGSMESSAGYIIKENSERVSHIITCRYQPDLDVTSKAWIYDQRLKSPPRWFKILAVTDHRLVYSFDCRLVERSDMATPPVATALQPVMLPNSVKL